MTPILNVRLESPALESGLVQIHDMEGTEALGRLFDFRVDLACKTEDSIDTEQLLAQPAALVFSQGDADVRWLYGMVSSVRDRLWTESPYLLYTVTFVPRAFGMTLNKMSRVFLDVSVPEILIKKLTDAGFEAGADFELRLLGRYAKRELTIQYEETDMQFISRLAEHVGITLFVEHRDGRDVLVFSDDNSRFPPVVGGPALPFHRRGEELGVFAFEGTTRTIPAKYVLKDYNYRTPTVDLVAQTSVADGGLGSVVEYGAHYKTKDEGDHMARIRAEEVAAMRRVFDGKSNVQTLSAGARFTLDGHPRFNEELLLIEVRHRASQTVFMTGTGSERTYTNEFRAIPAATPYRHARVTPKPKVHGAISGVIEAAEGGQYAELDEHGRYHVRFMLDQGDAPKGRASSLLRMAQPHAGPGYGFHFPLRDGVEVMLTCIDGDPDRPIITGAVPNPTTPSTVGDNNAKRNVIRTGGGTEINIDDNESGTRFKVTTPCKNTVFQMGAPNAPVTGIFMGTDQNAKMKAGDTIEIEADVWISESAPGIEITAGETITSKAGTQISETAPTIQMVGTDKIEATSAQVAVFGQSRIGLSSEGVIGASAPFVEIGGTTHFGVISPDVDIKGGSTVAVKAPSIEVSADAVLNAGAGAVINVNAGVLINVRAEAMVTIEGPGMVKIKGGLIKLN